MTTEPFVPLPVRPGEHACARFAESRDGERLAVAFVRDGLRRGHKVVYLCDSDDVTALESALAAVDDEVLPAIHRGQLALRPARSLCLDPAGTFDGDRVLELARNEHARALAEGYAGLSLTGEMSWVLCGTPAVSGDVAASWERRYGEEPADPTRVLLCQYDHARVGPGALADVAAAHGVDVSPELSAIGRDGSIAAALIRPAGTLRLAGELDFGCANALADVLDAHFHGPLRLDLEDIAFADVAGLRALRGRKGQVVTIAGASNPVRRLLALLGWDTDPQVELVETA
jgi:ABC-type transporter Mla MlaB component